MNPVSGYLNEPPPGAILQGTDVPDRPGFEEKFYDQFVPELLSSYAAAGG